MTSPVLGPLRLLVARIEIAAERRIETAGDGWPGATALKQVLDVLRADHEDDDTGAEASEMLHEVFGLDEVEVALLWCAAGGDLDASISLAYGHLRGVAGPSRPTVALALELVGVPTVSAGPFRLLGPGGALRRHRMLRLSEPEPWLSRELRVPDPVLARLVGGGLVDPAVAQLATELVPLSVPGGEDVARGLQNDASLVWIRAATGSAGGSLAADGFARLGLHCLAVDLHRHPAGEPVSEVLATAARDAGLSGRGLVVLGCEALADSAETTIFARLEDAAVPVVATSTKPWNPAWSPRLPLLVDTGPLPVEQRETVWRSSLGPLADGELRGALVGLRLAPEQIVETVRYAEVLAGARGVPLDGALVRESAKRVGGAGSAGSERLVASTASHHRPTFDDLVLPERVMGSLHRLVSWARHRDTLVVGGALRGRGRGIAALFTGNPGTGKTLSAHVVAEELSIDLFQVDLSAVVDKYIGETEKNLEKVFQAAEALDVVLFFDEADALFGSRSDVSDARDRYANQEVAYLLQRMENFDGITILSTNLRGNLDKAFSRRMSFIINFPDPDLPTRVRLWRHHLDQVGVLDADDPVSVERIAAAVDLAGGDVRNVVLGAAYDAVAAQEPVGHRHVLAAVRREYDKLGRVAPAL